MYANSGTAAGYEHRALLAMLRLTRIATLIHGRGDAVLQATLVPCGRRVVARIVDRDVTVEVDRRHSSDPTIRALVDDAIDKQRILMEGKPDHMF